MSLVIHMQNGLDGEHGAHNGGGGVDAPAPFQVHQVIDGKPVAQVQPVI